MNVCVRKFKESDNKCVFVCVYVCVLMCVCVYVCEEIERV